mgnify:CR=1 FL=1
MSFKFTLKLLDPRENWWTSTRKELNEVVERYNRSTWPTQRSPADNVPWKPRKPPTGTWPILRRSGFMQDSAKFYTKANQPMEFFAETVYYGPFMQYGTRYVPPRVWLAIGPRVIPAMEKTIARKLFKGRGKKILVAGGK